MFFLVCFIISLEEYVQNQRGMPVVLFNFICRRLFPVDERLVRQMDVRSGGDGRILPYAVLEPHVVAVSRLPLALLVTLEHPLRDLAQRDAPRLPFLALVFIARLHDRREFDVVRDIEPDFRPHRERPVL